MRTLAASTVGASPLGYHHGAVWPHDTAIAAAGLMRYGFVDESLRLLGGLLDAAVAFGGRLPELFAGFDRADLDFPVPFPNACVPVGVGGGVGAARPAHGAALRPVGARRHACTWRRCCPTASARLRVDDIPLLGGRISVAVDGGGSVVVEGVPPGIEVVSRAPAHPWGASPGVRPEPGLAGAALELLLGLTHAAGELRELAAAEEEQDDSEDDEELWATEVHGGSTAPPGPADCARRRARRRR